MPTEHGPLNNESQSDHAPALKGGAAGGGITVAEAEALIAASVPLPYRRVTPPTPEILAESEAITEAVFAELSEGINVIEAEPQARHPLYFPDPLAPLWTVEAEAGGKEFVPNGTHILAPAGIVVAAGTDRHLGVFQPRHPLSPFPAREFDFWHATVESVPKNIKYKFGGEYDPYGSGVGKFGGLSSATASGFGLGVGQIMAHELYAGYIPHALFITISRAAKVGNTKYGHGVKTGPESSFIFPATGGGTAAELSENLPPMGAWSKLEMTYQEIYELRKGGNRLAPWKMAILVAWKEFGAFIGDTGGGNGKDGGGLGIFMEDGASYVAMGRPNPILKYCEERGGKVAKEVKEEIELFEAPHNFRFHMDESVKNSVVPWKTKLKWLAPPPENPVVVGVNNEPYPGRLYAPTSPFNIGTARALEGEAPANITAGVRF